MPEIPISGRAAGRWPAASTSLGVGSRTGSKAIGGPLGGGAGWSLLGSAAGNGAGAPDLPEGRADAVPAPKDGRGAWGDLATGPWARG